MTSNLPRSRLVALCLALVAPGLLEARVYLSVEEALDLAFPGCEVERETVFLTEGQQSAASRLAGAEIPRRIVHPYRARCEDPAAGGVAYFDVHRVRTLEETLMVVVDPEGEVRRVEVLSFLEPPDYIPRPAWYAQFEGQELDDRLELDRTIRPVTGATLTAVATTAAVRRVLAMHSVLAQGLGETAGKGETAGEAGEGQR